MMARFRKWLLSGLLAVTPLAITVWLVDWAISSMDKTLLLLPQSWHPDAWLPHHIPGLGVIFVLVVLLCIGAITSNFLGKRLLGWWNGFLNRIPIVRSVYSSVKQVSDTLFAGNGNAFRTAVLVQWPMEGSYTIGFVTGTPGAELQLPSTAGDEWLSVYIPTTPNPTGGYLMMFKKSQCMTLSISVDSALKYIVSMGVVPPTAANTRAPLNPKNRPQFLQSTTEARE